MSVLHILSSNLSEFRRAMKTLRGEEDITKEIYKRYGLFSSRNTRKFEPIFLSSTSSYIF